MHIRIEMTLYLAHVGLWLVVITNAVAIALLYNYIAIQHIQQTQGPPYGSSLAELHLRSIDGAGVFPIDRRYTFLFVAGPECVGCMLARQHFRNLAARQRDTVASVAIFAGGLSETRAYASDLQPHITPVADPSRRVREALRVVSTPFGILLDRTGRVVKKGYLGSTADLDDFLHPPDSLVRSPQVEMSLTDPIRRVIERHLG